MPRAIRTEERRKRGTGLTQGFTEALTSEEERRRTLERESCRTGIGELLWSKRSATSQCTKIANTESVESRFVQSFNVADGDK